MTYKPKKLGQSDLVFAL